MTRVSFVLLLLAACEPEPVTTEPRDEPTADELPAQPPPSAPPEPVVHPAAEQAPSAAPRRIVQALEDDDSFGSSEPVDARRIVYRVLLHVPRSLGDAPPTVPAPAAELHLDVAADRLRARFVGAGWPVEAGSEVRLRGDRPGVYVFDARGGRPLAPGQMAEWFQGGPPGSDPPAVRVRPPPPHEDVGQGALICALLAEWSGQSRETLARRCGERGPPAMFRLGPWFGERTADVPVSLPRSSVRADHEAPPRPIVGSNSRAFVEPELLSRLPASRPRRDRDPPDEDRPSEGLRVRNTSATRVVITGHGIPIGWVDPGAEALLVGLPEGQHLVAALRPLGQLALHPRGVAIPATVTIR